MQNIEFIKKINPVLFIIWWSYSIKKQIPFFRDFSDIDIMVQDIDYIKYLTQKEKLECVTSENEYGELHIEKIHFPDKSSIDIIKNWSENTLRIEGFNYLTINEIIKYKVDLLFNNIELNVSIENKHLKDLFFLLKNWYNIESANKTQTAFYTLFPKDKPVKDIPVNDIPF